MSIAGVGNVGAGVTQPKQTGSISNSGNVGGGVTSSSGSGSSSGGAAGAGSNVGGGVTGGNAGGFSGSGGFGQQFDHSSGGVSGVGSNVGGGVTQSGGNGGTNGSGNVTSVAVGSVDATHPGVSISSSVGGGATTPIAIFSGNIGAGVTATGRTALERIAETAASTFGVPPNILKGVISQESAWNPYAVSGVGAYGLAQLMPKTAIGLGVNPYDPAQNIQGGARYLAQMFAKYGNWNDALKAYNVGPGNYDKILAGTKVEPAETANYPAKVMAYVNAYGGADAVPVTKDSGGFFNPLPAPKPLIQSFDANTASKVGSYGVPSELVTRSVTTFKVDQNGNPIIAPETPPEKVGTSTPWQTVREVVFGKSSPAEPASQKVQTVYVSPDGTERTPARAGDVAIPPGIVPGSVASWWQKAFQPKLVPPTDFETIWPDEYGGNGLPLTTREAIIGGAYMTGPAWPVGGSLKAGGSAVAGPTAVAAASDLISNGIPITVHGGNTTFTAMSDFSSVGGSVTPDDQQGDFGGSNGASNVGAGVTAVNISEPVFLSPITIGNSNGFANSPVVGNGSGGVISGGSGSSIPVHHDPFQIPDLPGDPFEAQYFNLDDLLNSLNRGSGSSGSRGGSGSVGSSGGSLNPLLLLALAGAGAGASFMLRHKQ